MIEISIQKKLKAQSGEMVLRFDASIKEGEFITLYGASGAGKTSTLRMLAGLMSPDDGHIEINNRIWYDRKNKINLPPQKREIGLLFQDYALFPNMTVKENVVFALKKGQDNRIVEDLMKIIELENLQHRMPESLSGGQQQRVALARALVQKPKLLLLDEPLSALDMQMRSKLQDHLINAHNQFGLTTIMVSHDLSEIFKLSDKVIELKEGQIIKSGSIPEVFSHPELSGKLQFKGQIVNIQTQEVVVILTIIVGNELTKVVVDIDEIKGLSSGDHVLIASKGYNSVVKRIN